MPSLRLLADEHVPSIAVTALESHGFSVETAQDLLGESTDDSELLAATAELDRIVLTHDRDFVRLHDSVQHAGILVYTTQTLEPTEFVRAIRRIDAHLGPSDLSDDVEWVERWIE